MNKIMLDRLQDRFVKLIDDYMIDNKLNQNDLAKIVGLPHSRISNLRSTGENNNYRRRLSANYLLKFIIKGVLMKKDIYDDSPESKREEEFWDVVTVLENTEIQKKLTKALNGSLTLKGLNAFLDTHISENGS